MSHSLKSFTGIVWGSVMGVMKADTSVDNTLSQINMETHIVPF